MPKRGRNRTEWVRYGSPPYGIMADSGGYPLKVGDIVNGRHSGKPYVISHGLRSGRTAFIATRVGIPTKNISVLTIREGVLHPSLRVAREADRKRHQTEGYNFIPANGVDPHAAKERIRLDAQAG